MTKNQYNSQAREYDSLREGLHQKYLKRPSIERLIDSNLKGKKVLDLACGEGEFSRFLAQRGADVIGLDLSSALIDVAKNKSKMYSNINYLVGDAFKLQGVEGKFDLIVGVYLLNYASSKKELNEFTIYCKEHLKENGKMLFLVPDYDWREYYKGYGVESFRPKNESDKLKFNLFDDEGTLKLELECVYWKTKTYEEAFSNAGFEFKEKPLIVSQEGVEKFGEEFWKEVKEHPIFKIYELTI